MDIEAKINSELCANHCVIATGGSVIYREKAMQYLKSLGKMVYLKLSYETVERRIGDMKERGVACKEGFSLRDLYEERKPLYEKYADITVELDGKTIEQSVQAVAEAIE